MDGIKDRAEQGLAAARENLRVVCALQNRNYSEVALEAGLSRNALSQFVAGKTSLSFANMLRICEALGVPIGIISRTDGITPGRIRLHRTLERLPEHLAEKVYQIAREERGRDQD